MRSPKEEFREYCPLTSEEVTALAAAVYVLDTNVLLHLYRYSETARDQFLELLRSVRKQLFIPYRVALEFHRNRAEVIAEQLSIADKTLSALDAEIKNLDAALDSVLTHKYHPYIDRLEVMSGLKDALIKARSAIADGSQRYHADFGADPLLEAVHEVIDGHIGEPFSQGELAEIYKEGEDRYSRQVPPGYKDIKKSAPDRYGDLVLWKETLRYGTTHQCPAIIVTDDNKEDWMLRTHGRTISIRPEMRREYYDATGQPVWLYTPEQFMRDTSKSLGQTVQPDILNEISDQTEDARVREEFCEAVTELAAQSSATAAALDAAKAVGEPEPSRTPSPKKAGWGDPLTYAESAHALSPDTLARIRTSAQRFTSEALRKALVGLDTRDKTLLGTELFNDDALRRSLGLDPSLWAGAVLTGREVLRNLDASLWPSSVLMGREATLDALRANKVLFDATTKALHLEISAARAASRLQPEAEESVSQGKQAKLNSKVPPSDQRVPAESESLAGRSTDPSEARRLLGAPRGGKSDQDLETLEQAPDPSSEQ